MAMMQHTGMERNKDQWSQLLSSAGFEIVRIWWAELGTTAIIEADLKEAAVVGATSGSITQADADADALTIEKYAGPQKEAGAATDIFAVIPNGPALTINGFAITNIKTEEAYA
jgi:hypothetical protein